MNFKYNYFCFLFAKWTDESAWYYRVVVRFGKYVGTAGTNATYRHCKSPLFTSLLPVLSHPPIRSPSRLYHRSRPTLLPLLPFIPFSPQVSSSTITLSLSTLQHFTKGAKPLFPPFHFYLPFPLSLPFLFSCSVHPFIPLSLIVLPEVGTRNFLFESAIAIPQLEGSTSAIAIPQLFKEMLLRNSAIAMFLKSATWELYFRNFRRIFGREIRSIHDKKFGGQKISCYCPFKASFWFPKKQTVLKIVFLDFLNPSWAEEKGL
jgi:hypothetical protein